MRFGVVLLVALAVAGAAGAAFTARTLSPASTLSTAASFACDYPAVVNGTGSLASYWRLGESSGATAVDSNNQHNGTYTGTHTKGVAGAIAGDGNTAVLFGGGYVDVGDNLDFPGTASFSLEAWIRPTTIDTVFRRIVSKNRSEGAGRQGYEFWIESANGVGFERFRDGVKDYATTTAPALNTWSHVVATYDGATMRLYLNGTLRTSTASTLSMTDNGAQLRVGTGDWVGDSWTGDLDDISVYTGALSAAQVQSRFQCGRRYRDVVLDTPGLQSYWRLGEASGVTAFDSKGTANGAHNFGPTLGGAGATTHANDATIFDGVDDFIDFGDVHDFPGTASFTVEGWINRGTVGEADKWRWIATKESIVDPRDGWALAVAPGSSGSPQTIYFNRFSGGTEHVVTSTTATVAGTWYHFAATYDGATMRMYVNGALEGSTASTLSIPNTTFPMRMSSAAPPSVHRFSGRIDEIAVYSTALSAPQIAEHYRAR